MQQHYCQKNTGVMKTPTKFKPKWEKKKLYQRIFIGHTDLGKSTARGHLIYECGLIHQRSTEIFKKEAAQKGKGSFKHAWVLDKLKAKCECGNTTDSSLWKFKSSKYYVTMVEAPRIQRLSKICLQAPLGLTTLSCLLLLALMNLKQVAPRTGRPVSEHALLAYTLSMKPLIISINNLDYAESPYS